MEDEPARPVGIVILCVLYVIAAIVVLGFIVPALSAARPVGMPSNTDNAVALLWVEAFLGIVAAVGLWLLQEWGRWLAIARAVFAGVAPLLANGSQPVTGSALVGTFISLLVIIYLLQPGVRRAFH